MAELDDFNAFLDARGYEVDASDQAPALAKAGDYILANYRLRDPSTFSAMDTARYQLAKFSLANEFADNAPALLKSQAVKSQQDSVDTGLFSTTAYYDAPADPYPQITLLLAPLLYTALNANYSVGRLTRDNPANFNGRLLT